MKIAQINMLPNGSTGKIMFGIAQAAQKEGHCTRTYSPMIFARGRKIEPPTWPEHMVWGSRWENCIHYYLGTLLGINGLLSWLGTRRLLRDLDTFDPDVIHLHNLHNYTINLPMLFGFLKKRQVKVVWTLHDCWSFTGHCPYFDMVNCQKWMTECGKCPQKEIYPKTYLDTTRWMHKKKKKWFSDIKDMTVVTPSKWLKELAEQSFLKEYPIKVIHNGIDLTLFSPQESDLKSKLTGEKEFLLLAVAFDWGKRKGLDVLVELAHRLEKQYQLVLVGTDDAVDRLLPKKVLSIHRTENQAELARLYSAADLLVNPTREDNFPTVNLETLACGTPVVTFETGGSPESLTEQCGRVVPCDDIDAMEQAIRDICENQALSAEACVHRAQEFDMYKKFGEYVRLYEAI